MPHNESGFEAQKLAVGLTGQRTIIVDQSRTIEFMGEELRVYATPEIVWDAEMLCRDLLLSGLDAGEDSVGTRIELDHLAPALPDMPVEIVASIAKIEGRLVTFDVSVRDNIDLVARGRHSRFIVSLAKTRERLIRKYRQSAKT